MNALKSGFSYLCFFIATLGTFGYRIPEALGVRKGRGAGMTASIITFALIQTPLLVLSVTHNLPAAKINLWIAGISLLIGLIIIGPADQYMARRWGATANHTGKKAAEDFNGNCWDEVVGMSFAGIPAFFVPDVLIMMYPGIANWPTWTTALIAWIMLVLMGAGFRVFDAHKFFGIKLIETHFENMSHNAQSKLMKTTWLTFGIMLDDIAAAIYGVVAPIALFFFVILIASVFMLGVPIPT